jgi:sec-independent protein translocase protein TatB
MLDLGLTKIAVIGVVALVVIGPEKLPQVARMAGKLYGRAQRYISDVKSEVSREIDVEGLRDLHKEVLDSARGIKSDVVRVTSDIESTVSASMGDVESAWHGDMMAPAPWAPPASPDDFESKARDFRRKKLVRTSSVPAWYKNRQGTRKRVLSGAARVRTFRPGVKSNTSFFQ